MKTGQTHMMRYMQPLLDRIQAGEIDPSFVSVTRCRLTKLLRRTGCSGTSRTAARKSS